MNRPARAVRTATGRPLLALAGLVACWIGARLAVLELPDTPAAIKRAPTRLIELASLPAPAMLTRGHPRIRIPELRPATGALARVVLSDATARVRSAGHVVSAVQVAVPYPVPTYAEGARGSAPTSARVPPLESPTQAGQAGAQLGSVLSGTAGRWSGDVWLALRQGSSSLGAVGAAVPVYGASQAGAVLRYELAPGSHHRPAAYARAVQALAGGRESDLATGLAARLVAGVPLTAHVEARLSRRGGAVDIRPAAFVAAGFDEAPLPLGMRARGYAQAGYVGGQDATGFADGSLLAERRMLSRGATEFGAGAGLWGGAQRGAARLDFGPSASLRFPLGGGTGRIAVDYRLRVAGNAEPASGAALTLSTGF